MVSFSVIVPIYNGEKYISRAVESVLSQSYPAKEIILIDDGSKDSSYKKCTELAEAHSEIRCIHKENSGVSETRNLGMSIAVSDYIVFLDCDDYLPKDALKAYADSIEQNDSPDLVIANNYSDLNGNLKLMYRMKGQQYVDRNELYKLICGFKYDLDFKSGNLRTVWAKAFKRSAIKDIKFDPKVRIGEDMLFLTEFVIGCGSIFMIEKPTYVYFQNESSVMHTITWKGTEESDYIFDKLVRLFKPLVEPRYLGFLFYEFEERVWIALSQSDLSTGQKYKILKKLITSKKYRRFHNVENCTSRSIKTYSLLIKFRLTSVFLFVLFMRGKIKKQM